jgi:hypothetical protein
MMMTYATGGVREMLHNWVLHVQRLGLPVLVAAMDKAVVSMAVEKHFDCLDWSHTATGADRQYVRGSFDGFRALGVRKIDALLPVLRAGVHVVLSDVDCVWSSSPLPMFHGQISGFEDFAHADLLVATDCMDPEDDHRNHGCYHDTVDKNTGVLAVRATPNGIAAMAEWRIRLAVGQKDEQDQTTFNDLLDGNGRGHRNWLRHAVAHRQLHAQRQLHPLCLPHGIAHRWGLALAHWQRPREQQRHWRANRLAWARSKARSRRKGRSSRSPSAPCPRRRGNWTRTHPTCRAASRRNPKRRGGSSNCGFASRASRRRWAKRILSARARSDGSPGSRTNSATDSRRETRLTIRAFEI